MATEQGLQDLNLMALPPAPEHADPLAAPLYTSPETPAGTTNETPVDMPIGTQMETPMNMPTGTQMETPMDISAGMPMEAPVNAPTDASPNNPIDLLLSLDAPMPMPDIPGPAGGPQPAGLPVQESGPEVPAGDAGQVPPTLADTSILAPMPTPEPAPEPAVAAGPQEMTMQCHSCGGNYTAIIEAYPALVQCPVCGTQGMLNG